MKEKLTNNMGLKILAIFVAFFVWLIVSNVSNPQVPKSQEVAVEIRNENILSSNNLTYEVVGKKSVTVSYDVRTLDAYKVTASDFKAYVDMTELYAVTGAIPIHVDVVNHKSMIDNLTTKPGVIQIKTEPIQTKQFELKVQVVGEPEEGYALGTVALSQSYVEVTGAVSVIGQISSVGVEIEADGKNGDFSGTAKPILYDANGNKLNLEEDTTLQPEEITYQVPVLKVKPLSLDFQVKGAVADGYRFTGVECDIKSVSVEGLKSTLASLTTLTVPGEYLNLDGATRDQVVKVDLRELLPENVNIVNGQETIATVTLNVEPLQKRSFSIPVAGIELVGASDDYRYTFNTNVIHVDVEGLLEDLDSLELDKMKPSVNVSEMTAGTFRVSLDLELGEGFEALNSEGFELTVAAVNGPADEMTSSAQNGPTENETAEETKTPPADSE